MIKTKIQYLYICTFINDRGSRDVKVVSSSFGGAAGLAYSIASNWEDYDSFELRNIHVQDIVITKL